MPFSHPIRPPSLVLVLILAACGGYESTPQEADAPAQDTLVRSIEREPLTEADWAGLAASDLVVELPWTENRVSRDGDENAARASLQAVELSGHEGFDRTVFRFTDSAPFPGYQIHLAEPGATITCGEEGEEKAMDVEGPVVVVLRLRPARASDQAETWVPVRTRRVGQDRILEAGLVCDEGGAVTWVASVADAGQVRVLELRGPNRLVLDVR